MSSPIRPLPELRRVDVADVYKDEVLAGQLRRERHDVVFRYAPQYLADQAAPPVAWSIPRTSPRTTEPARGGAGAVPAFFAGLLPEGVRLGAVATGTRTSLDDHLTLLLAVGGDTIGDVRVVPAGDPPLATTMTIAEEEVARADLTEVFAAAVSPRSGSLERIALPGVQEKVSAAMLSMPVGTPAGPAILKLNPPALPRLVENEHFFLRMARDCGLVTARTRLVHDRHGRAGLLVARFDRLVGGATEDGSATDGGGSAGPRRLAQEDGCQLLAVYPAAKYRVRTEQVARGIVDVVTQGGGSRPLALRRVLELVAFSYLIGNGDLHGKNFSARAAPDGVWEVTPAYDLLSTQPYLSWSDPMALDLFGRANRLDRRHLLESAQRLGLPAGAAEGALSRICDAAPAWIVRLGEIGLDTGATERLAGLVEGRLTELRGERGDQGR